MAFHHSCPRHQHSYVCMCNRQHPYCRSTNAEGTYTWCRTCTAHGRSSCQHGVNTHHSSPFRMEDPRCLPRFNHWRCRGCRCSDRLSAAPQLVCNSLATVFLLRGERDTSAMDMYSCAYAAAALCSLQPLYLQKAKWLPLLRIVQKITALPSNSCKNC